MQITRATVATALLTVCAAVNTLAAQATFDFANLHNNKGAGSFLPSVSTNTCTAGDICSLIGGGLSYTKGGFGVTATGFYNDNAAMVVQDADDGYSSTTGAGLGVYHQFDGNAPSNGSDDNITTGERLKLTFSQRITMSSLGLRSDGHNFTNWTSNAFFQYRVDGGSWFALALPTNVGLLALNKTGTTFEFRFNQDFSGGKNADQFYVSSATVTSTVPEPATYALVATGLLGIGIAAQRRRKRTK